MARPVARRGEMKGDEGGDLDPSGGGDDLAKRLERKNRVEGLVRERKIAICCW